MSQPSTVNIADRSNVFYWQTDRAIDPQQAGEIWSDRHRYFTDNAIIHEVNSALTGETLAELAPLDLNSQTNLGNVNSVRLGTLASGSEVVVRCHPRGIRNGYFHAETAAAHLAYQNGLPSYETFVTHDYQGADDFAFQVIGKLPGTAIKKWLEARPADETTLVPQIGKMMARLHQIKVSGFGPFDNEIARQGELIGLHPSLAHAMRAALPFNLETLRQENILSENQSMAIAKLFSDTNPALAVTEGVLVHNDFADWNLLTDDLDITGILDWDECVGGDPIADIACWSTFFKPERLQSFLDGYWQIAEKPADFNEKFELFRLRYVLSKLTLRLRRYSWDQKPLVKTAIETGHTHLQQSMTYFDL